MGVNEFVVLARWTARKGEEENVGRILKLLADATRSEAGCLQYSVHRSADDPAAYVLYERYVDEAAYQVHAASGHFRDLALNDGIPRLASRAREFYSVVD